MNKLTTYLAERERAGGRFVTDAMLDLFAARGVATSVLLRGIASFGPRNIVRTDESLSLSEDLPVTIAAVDTPEVIGALMDDVVALIGRGLLTLERARLVDGEFPVVDGGDAVRMTLYVCRQQRAGGVAAHVAACAVFHRLGFAGAIVYLGVDGTVGGQRRRAKCLSRSRNSRSSPTRTPATTASPSTAPWYAGSADPITPAAPPCSAACGGSPMTDRRTATGCSGWAEVFRSPPSWSTPRMPSQPASTSSTNSPPSTVW